MEQDSLIIKHLEGQFDSLNTRLDKMGSLDNEFLDVSTKRMDILETYVRTESSYNMAEVYEPFIWLNMTALLIFGFFIGRMIYLNHKMIRRGNRLDRIDNKLDKINDKI